MKTDTSRLLALVCLLLVSIYLTSFYSGAASANDFATAEAAINSAYIATHNSEKNGGNVTVLVNELNIAIGLVEKAQAENLTQPAQAVADLQNATRIAILVSNQSSAITDRAASTTQSRNMASIGSAIAIVLVAALIYLYGGRIYRRAWLYLYRNHVVKPNG